MKANYFFMNLNSSTDEKSSFKVISLSLLKELLHSLILLYFFLYIPIVLPLFLSCHLLLQRNYFCVVKCRV